jgi:hypothetical protein
VILALSLVRPLWGQNSNLASALVIGTLWQGSPWPNWVLKRRVLRLYFLEMLVRPMELLGGLDAWYLEEYLIAPAWTNEMKNITRE